MSVTSNLSQLNVNLQDLAKSLDVLTEKLAPVLVPESTQAMPPKDEVAITSPSVLAQDIQKYSDIVSELNIKCSSLISRMDIL